MVGHHGCTFGRTIAIDEFGARRLQIQKFGGLDRFTAKNHPPQPKFTVSASVD
jgi:hypothetical protein